MSPRNSAVSAVISTTANGGNLAAAAAAEVVTVKMEDVPGTGASAPVSAQGEVKVDGAGEQPHAPRRKRTRRGGWDTPAVPAAVPVPAVPVALPVNPLQVRNAGDRCVKKLFGLSAGNFTKGPSCLGAPPNRNVGHTCAPLPCCGRPSQ